MPAKAGIQRGYVPEMSAKLDPGLRRGDEMLLDGRDDGEAGFEEFEVAGEAAAGQVGAAGPG